MGILQRLGLTPRAVTLPPPEVLAAPIYASMAGNVTNMGVEELWRMQPHLRTVTDFIARSVASTSLHAFKRQPDGGRDRIRDGAIAELCKKANSSQLMSTVIHRAVMDICLYDEWIWVLREAADLTAPEILPIPPSWVQRVTWEDPWTLKAIYIADETTGQPIEIMGDRVIRQSGYHPMTMKRGSSPIQSLRTTLNEQLEAAQYRAQLWKNGPRLGAVIERPQNAAWDKESRERFRRSMAAWFSGAGSRAGGVPILEDGMTLKPFHLKAQDEQVVEVTKLSLQTVASAFHINPTMVGLLDNANYSNVKEFRKSLYGDSLGPIIKQLEDVLNLFVLPKLSNSLEDLDGVYLEFNIDEKLRASFEEKAAVTSRAVGAPWMLIDEAREQNNLPKIEGGDRLIMPLNLGLAGNGQHTPEEVVSLIEAAMSLTESGMPLADALDSVGLDPGIQESILNSAEEEP